MASRTILISVEPVSKFAFDDWKYLSLQFFFTPSFFPVIKLYLILIFFAEERVGGWWFASDAWPSVSPFVTKVKNLLRYYELPPFFFFFFERVPVVIWATLMGFCAPSTSLESPTIQPSVHRLWAESRIKSCYKPDTLWTFFRFRFIVIFSFCLFLFCFFTRITSLSSYLRESG